MMAGLAMCCLACYCWASPISQNVYLASQDGNTVSVVDTGTNDVSARIEVSEKPVFIAVSRNGERAYVTHPDSSKISVVDLQGKRVESVFDFPGEPFAVVLSADEKYLFVTDWK